MRTAAACALCAAGGTADAQVWQIEPSVTAEVTFTDNAGLAASRDKQSDFVLQLSPAVAITERGAHTRLTGSINVPILLYARTSENNDVRPEVSLVGTAELYPSLFFVDASVSVTQQFFSPFGPRPQNLVNATDNRYTSQAYRISPYVKGETANGLRYELRDSNVWTDEGNTPEVTNRAYTNEISGYVTREPTPFGGGFEFDRTDTKFSNQDPLLTQIARARGRWRPDPQWEFSAIVGYEDNRYPLEDFAGTTYGAGFKWRPSERTSVDASWEHRFFGNSYHLSFDHRTPLTTWSLRAFRDITSYPQQLANLTGQGDVNAILNGLFAGRILDPVARQTFINQLIRDRGLPPTLAGPLALFTQQITLQQSLAATVTLIGARNSVLMTVFRTRSEPIGSTASTVSEILTNQIDNTQTGTNVVWTQRLTPLYTLATSLDWVRTVANEVSNQRSNQGTLQVMLSAPLAPLTRGFAGARYQHFTSNIQDDIDEAAVFVGISHTFR